MKYIHPDIIRQIFTLAVIVILGGLIFTAMLPYLAGVLGAITIYVLLSRPMSKLVGKGWRPSLAAAVLLLLSFFCILIPVAGVVVLLGNKIGKAVKNSEKVVEAVKGQLGVWEDRLGYDLSSQINVSGITSWLTENLQQFVGGTFNMFIAIAIMYFMLYFMLTNQSKLRNSLFGYLPIGEKNLKIIGEDARSMVRSNAIGIPLVALAQGIVALIGYLIFGVKDPFFWAAITTIGSMVPLIGAFSGIVPVFLLELTTGNTFQAWGILLYGIIVVGSTDNLIRLYVLRKLDDVHPLITLIGVIVGVPIFGFIGLIFGPLLISLFLIIVRIYRREYGEKDTQRL